MCKSLLSIGTSYGCLTIKGYDKYISFNKEIVKYRCQCKCGNIFNLSEEPLTRKRWRDCEGLKKNQTCSIKKERDNKRLKSYPRIKDRSYFKDYSYSTHESLEILECIDENFEGKTIVHDKRKKDGGEVRIYKLYLCRCHLCNKEFKFKSSDFEIKNDRRGRRAEEGYYCVAHCGCHKISSFQWRTIKILTEHNIPYKAEVSFQNLFGIGNKNLLRYDFAILNKDGSIKCLIECQGEQHYNPLIEFGGVSQYKIQIKNDELKKIYARSNNITLFEIPYSLDTYKKELTHFKAIKFFDDFFKNNLS